MPIIDILVTVENCLYTRSSYIRIANLSICTQRSCPIFATLEVRSRSVCKQRSRYTRSA